MLEEKELQNIKNKIKNKISLEIDDVIKLGYPEEKRLVD